MVRNWNAYPHYSAEFESGVQIWGEPPKEYISGGMVVNKLIEGEKLAGGSPVEFNVKTKEAKILRLFRVDAVETQSTNTIISVAKAWDLPIVKKGDVLMVMPTTISGTGKAFVVDTLDDSGDNVSKITVATESIDTVKVGSFLVESASEAAGTGKKIFCTPNTLTKEDTVAANQNSVGIVRGECYVFENVIPPMPDVIKDNLKHVVWDWVNEKVEGGDYAE